MPTECCCDRCERLMAYDPGACFYEEAICGACRESDREPQGEAVRLFTPAPDQMPGQTSMGLPDNPPHNALRHHVSGKIASGEAEPITERRG